jgi:xylitol oxidase
MRRTNWAGNYTYRARRLHSPSTLEQVQEIAASASRLRALGSGHSFTDIADSAELLTVRRLPAEVVVDDAARTVSLAAGLSYGELAVALAPKKMALANLASLPHISVAGAVATASHGSGDTNGNLATAVAAIEMVTSDGEVLTASRADADFNGLVVGLGALGVVTRITISASSRVFAGRRCSSTSTRSPLMDIASACSPAGARRWIGFGSRIESRKRPSRRDQTYSEPLRPPRIST